MFDGPVVWRGLVYTLLTLLGKVTTGLWLLQLHVPSSISAPLLGSMSLPSLRCWGSRSAFKKGEERRADNSGVAPERKSRPEGIPQNEAADTPNSRAELCLQSHFHCIRLPPWDQLCYIDRNCHRLSCKRSFRDSSRFS